MAQDFEQFLKDVFGEQKQKMMAKLQELARETLKDELAKVHAEVAELRSRVTVLESERAQAAAEATEPSF